MRSAGLIVGLTFAALAVAIVPALAQISAASVGRGGTGFAIMDEETTGLANPALLGRGIYNWAAPMPAPASAMGGNWNGQIGASWDTEGYANDKLIQLAANRVGEDWGLALGWGSTSGDKYWYASFGKQLKAKPGGNGWFWGATLQVPQHLDLGFNKTTVDLGLAFTNVTRWFGGGIWSFGVIGRNVFDEKTLGLLNDWNGEMMGGFTVDAGLGLTYPRCRVAFDQVDVFDKVDRYWNAGAEYDVCPHFTGRIGLNDHDFTWGGSLHNDRIAVDFGRIEYSPGHYGMLGIRYFGAW